MGRGGIRIALHSYNSLEQWPHLDIFYMLIPKLC